jgi:hypothetical protein
MPKIRDLGINFIPATMRPPEIGPGGGREIHPPPCNPCTDNSPQCEPHSDCAEGSRGPYEAGSLSYEAIGQLKQQLHDYIGI